MVKKKIFKLFLCKFNEDTLLSRQPHTAMCKLLDANQVHVITLLTEKLTYRQNAWCGAPTNAGKHVTPNIACAHCQRYTDNSVI